MSLAYSAMARSEENQLIPEILRRAALHHRSGARQKLIDRALSLAVSREIGGHHIGVGKSQRVGQTGKAVRVFAGKAARRHSLDDFREIG